MADTSRIEELRRRVQKDPASIAFAQLAEEYRRAGRLAEAIETCESGLSRHPGYLSARVTLGRALLDTGKLEEAQVELKRVLRVAPENLAALRGLADIHHRRGELKEALEHYKAALEFARQDPELAHLVEEISRKLEPAPAPVTDGLSFEEAQNEFLSFANTYQPPPPVSAPPPPDAARWLTDTVPVQVVEVEPAVEPAVDHLPLNVDDSAPVPGEPGGDAPIAVDLAPAPDPEPAVLDTAPWPVMPTVSAPIVPPTAIALVPAVAEVAVQEPASTPSPAAVGSAVHVSEDAATPSTPDRAAGEPPIAALERWLDAILADRDDRRNRQ